MQVTVNDVMTRDVLAVGPDTSLETAARLLSTRAISGAPVVTKTGRVIGVVSSSDLADPDRAKTEREGYPLFYRISQGHTTEFGDDVQVGSGCVADVMSPFVLCVESGSSTKSAARIMVAEHVHRLLVMENTKLVGIVSALDLLRIIAGVASSDKRESSANGEATVIQAFDAN